MAARPIKIIRTVRADGGHGTRIKAGNGKIIYDSGEGYARPVDRDAMIDKLISSIQSGDFVIVDE